jgi:gamma-glutamyltranspeptidase/glutathione hydrolase
MQFDPLAYQYPARRNVVYAKKGMVATGQPLAAQAGLEILRQGGNAIDAAVATAACLTVVEPTGTGIGGDAFCLAWFKGQLYGLNASGPAPLSLSIEKLRQQGCNEIPP